MRSLRPIFIVSRRGLAKACVVDASFGSKRKDGQPASTEETRSTVQETIRVEAQTGSPIGNVNILAASTDPSARAPREYPAWLAAEVARPRKWASLSPGLCAPHALRMHGTNAPLMPYLAGVLDKTLGKCCASNIIARLRKGSMNLPPRAAVRWASRQTIILDNASRRKS